ncbi:hypothetical protein ACPYO6_01410 [Georgenia sp. Z1344]|uniref:hypothetical protein n=1 Tax=Georgenia sp. Z1344 TaxID=3416706 RepID=UPI003CF44DCA
MSGQIEVDEHSIRVITSSHDTKADRHGETTLPPEGDWGWGATHVTTISSKATKWTADVILMHAGASAAVQHAWETLRANDEAAAEYFESLGGV